MVPSSPQQQEPQTPVLALVFCFFCCTLCSGESHVGLTVRICYLFHSLVQTLVPNPPIVSHQQHAGKILKLAPARSCVHACHVHTMRCQISSLLNHCVLPAGNWGMHLVIPKWAFTNIEDTNTPYVPVTIAGSSSLLNATMMAASNIATAG